MSFPPRTMVGLVLAAAIVTAGLMGLHSSSASVIEQNQTTETITVTTTLTNFNVTEIQWTTTTVPTYEMSTLTLTQTSTTTAVMGTTTTSITAVPVPTFFETTIASKTILTTVVMPSEQSEWIGLTTFFFVGVAFGTIAVAGHGREEGELWGGLLAGLGFVLWAIIEFLSGFPKESTELGFGRAFDYAWMSLAAVISGLFVALILGCLVLWYKRPRRDSEEESPTLYQDNQR